MARGRKKQNRTRKANGEGTINLRADGRWEGQITIGTDDNGKAIRKSVYGKTSEEVDLKLSELKVKLGMGLKMTNSKTILFGEYSKQWLTFYKKPFISAKTYEFYNFCLNVVYSKLEKIRIQDITQIMLQRIINDMINTEYSSRSLKGVKETLGQILEQAIDDNIIMVNYAKKIKLPTATKKPVKALSREEQDAFLKVLAGTRFAVPASVMVFAGLRLGELLALHWDDINLEDGIITIKITVSVGGGTLHTKVPKTETSKRKIPIPKLLCDALKEHKKAADKNIKVVFPNAKGSYQRPDNFRKWYHSIIEKSDVPYINPHALRHTYASRLLEAGEEIKVIQELLGHTLPSTTMDIYTHLMPDTKKKAVDKLDKLYAPKRKLKLKKGTIKEE